MATTDLNLDESGTLTRPGPLGRAIRFIFAFLLSGLIGSPGCEMRAFHHLYSKVTGKPTKEHYCPIGPLHAIDQWEAKRMQK